MAKTSVRFQIFTFMTSSENLKKFDDVIKAKNSVPFYITPGVIISWVYSICSLLSDAFRDFAGGAKALSRTFISERNFQFQFQTYQIFASIHVSYDRPRHGPAGGDYCQF